MSKFRQLLEGIFSQDAVFQEKGIKDSGMALSISEVSKEAVFGIKPEKVPNWPDGNSRCDAIFFLGFSPNIFSDIVFVELKKGKKKVEEAINQLGKTHDFLCRKSGTLSPHSKQSKKKFKGVGFKHSNLLHGIVVSKSGIRLAQYQKIRASLSKKGLLVRVKTGKPGKAVQMTATELTRRTQ